MFSRPVAAVLAVLSVVSTSVQAADLTLNLNGFREPKGHLMLLVQAGPEAWDGKAEPSAAQRVPVTGKEMQITVPGLAAGVYAVSLFHDANDNGKLDMNAMGMPLEGYGFSNNVGARGRPDFNAAKFDLPAAGVSLQIRVN